MPDLVGMKFDCPHCRHPFTVPTILRGARYSIPEPSLPVLQTASSFASFDEPILPTLDTNADSDAPEPPISDPHPVQPTPPLPDDSDNEPQALPTPPPTVSDPAPAPIPRRPRSTPRPRPPYAAPTPVKKEPEAWNFREATPLHLGLALIGLGICAIPIPLALDPYSLASLRRFVLVLCFSIILFGSLSCAVSLFRQHLTWIFAGTFGAIICIVLFAAGGVSRTPASFLPSDVLAAAPTSPLLLTSQPATAPARVPGYEALVNRYGDKRVVRINILPPPRQSPDALLAAKAHEILRPLADSWSLTRRPDHLECVLAPIDDFPALIQTLSTTGTVSNPDEQSKTITLRF
jgi:hypothetical protein